MEIVPNEPLAPFTTIRLGGKARFFGKASSFEDIRSALNFVREQKLPIHFFAGGSNTVFADDGFPGVVIKIDLKGTSYRLDDSKLLLTAQAGEDWDSFVEYAVGQGWAGLESLSGIPGSVGATPIQNVGAYGSSVSEVVAKVSAYDTETNEVVDINNQNCGFGYRTSRFKAEDAGRYIILSVTFALVPGGQPVVKYPDLSTEIDSSTNITPQAVRDAVLKIRARKGMAASQTKTINSCGSFFTNPIISREDFERLQALQSELVPSFPEPDNRMKIPAGWLIERAGFKKGDRRQGVGISPHHILALVNYTGTTHQLLSLAEEIQDKVQRKFGIQLSLEPVLVR